MWYFQAGGKSRSLEAGGFGQCPAIAFGSDRLDDRLFDPERPRRLPAESGRPVRDIFALTLENAGTGAVEPNAAKQHTVAPGPLGTTEAVRIAGEDKSLAGINRHGISIREARPPAHPRSRPRRPTLVCTMKPWFRGRRVGRSCPQLGTVAGIGPIGSQHLAADHPDRRHRLHGRGPV